MGEGAGRVLLIFNKGLGPLCFQLVIGLSPQLPNLLQDNVETYVDPCPTHFHPPTRGGLFLVCYSLYFSSTSTLPLWHVPYKLCVQR